MLIVLKLIDHMSTKFNTHALMMNVLFSEAWGSWSKTKCFKNACSSQSAVVKNTRNDMLGASAERLIW